jgi:predicted dehydrogenase
MARTIRVGIAGFDHFFAALGALNELQRDQDVKVVVMAHHDTARLAPHAEATGAQVTDDYRSVLDADIDLLITGCPTSRNAELLIAGAEKGLQLLSVKPYAMTMAEADRVVAAVERAGVNCMSFDATWRTNPLYQHARAALADGSLGRPLSAYCMMHSSLPEWVWFGNPFVHGRSWWLDPQQSPAGGWIDHSIYFVDALRWAMGSEVVRVSGETAKLRHTDEAHEDYGVATMVFANGAVATIEVTWHIVHPGSALAFEIVGSEGKLASHATNEGDPPNIKMVTTTRQLRFDAPGWKTLTLPQGAGGVTTNMLAVMRGEAEPLATIRDARANLAACYAFYTAARELRTVIL